MAETAEPSGYLKIYLRGWTFLSDQDQKSFAVLLADRLPDPCTPTDFLTTAQQLAADLENRVINNSHLSGTEITFLSAVYEWPLGQMSDDFMTQLRLDVKGNFNVA